MTKLVITNILRFLALIVLQVLILNYVYLGGYVVPFIYILAIMMLPTQLGNIPLLLIAFVSGGLIDIFCNILDPAENVKKVIKLKATGPVEMLETKSWSWDDDTNPVPPMVTGLRISKLVITFKDGQQKILVKDIIYKEAE